MGYIGIILIYWYNFIPWESFTPVLTGDFHWSLRNKKSPPGFLDSSHDTISSVWSWFFLWFPIPSGGFSKHWGWGIQSAAIITGLTVTFMFNSFIIIIIIIMIKTNIEIQK